MKRLTCLCLISLYSASTAEAITIDLVSVGNPGNAPDTRYDATGFGSVANAYKIGKYEVTAGQYTAFLNAVADADPDGLYNTAMGDPSGLYGANIQRTGSSPNYSYSVAADWANRPVNYVSFWDGARFANWLHNGQPTGAQGPGTTEDGAYLNIGNQATFARQSGARFFIPTEDEWYKAAYHDKNAGLAASYFDYPTGSNTAPINTLPDPGNHANFYDVPGTGNNGYTIDSPYYRTEAGAFVNSTSRYDTFDQGGNVYEWNETKIFSTGRGMRGGSFNSNDLRASSRPNLVPTNEVFYVGFRVASIPELPGDYNNNGTVDAADYVLWRNGGPLANQVDDPSSVNADDYAPWRARFGNPGLGAGGSDARAIAAVPEPATSVLLMFAIAGWCLRRRRAA